MKNFILSVLLGQIEVIKAKIDEAIKNKVAELAEPQNIAFIEGKKDEILASVVSLLPVQARLFYNLPFVKAFIDDESNRALEFFLSSMTKNGECLVLT